MGLFECAICGHFRNSDDGCSEDPINEVGLICSDCFAELDYQHDIAEDERDGKIDISQG